MNRIIYLGLIFIFTIIFFSCSTEAIKEPISDKINLNLEYFGFTLIDVGWDDPTDSEEKTNYVDEISAFSNLADILVISPTDDIKDKLNVFELQGVKAVIHLNEIFFEEKSKGGNKSGVLYGLRSDYQARWDTFDLVNNLNSISNNIACFYIGEEPSWNGISESEFKEACDYAKLTVPLVPILNIEAYFDVDSIYTPNSVDWIGFDHYFIPNPETSTTFLSEISTVKSKMKTHQKMMLVLDSHWLKYFHGSAGITKQDMDLVAREYYNIANNDTTIIGMVGYFWPSGFDIRGSIGARNLPSNVKEEYEKIGKQITGK